MIPGPKVLIIGEPGSGKTYSLRTLLRAGLTPFVILTEQSQHTLIEGIYYHYIRPTVTSWADMAQYAKVVNSTSMDGLQKARDPAMAVYRQFIEFLNFLAKPKCDRTGREFQPVDYWGPAMCLVVDTLSGVNEMSLNLVTGGRAARTLPEWLVAQAEEAKLIKALCNLNCTLIINTHPEQEKDEVSGRTRTYPSALGNKLAPKLGRDFDEVIAAERIGKEFTWNNISDTTATKFRLLPPAAKTKQNYGLLIEAWQQVGGELVEEWPHDAVN